LISSPPWQVDSVKDDAVLARVSVEIAAQKHPESSPKVAKLAVASSPEFAIISDEYNS